MRLLLVSDLHRDVEAATIIVGHAASADVVVGAGDFAVMRRGLGEIINRLAAITTPVVLVPGNAESAAELSAACEGWPAARVLHGAGVEIDGVAFFGLGGGVPVTPFGDWSYDLTETEAEVLLAACPDAAVLVSHSPPLGHCDLDGAGRHLGSSAVLAAVESRAPRLVVCGHIHASWGERTFCGETPVVNAGPSGIFWELD